MNAKTHGYAAPFAVAWVSPAHTQRQHATHPQRPFLLACSVVFMSFVQTAIAQTRFAEPVPYTVGARASSITVIDANADGLPDLATANRDGETVSLLINSGQGLFGPAVDFAVAEPGVAARPRAVRAADIDQDGHIDLIAANETEGAVVVLFNDGASQFHVRVSTPVARFPSALTVMDFDGDDDMDIALSHKPTGGGGRVDVLINRGSSSGTWLGFEPIVEYQVFNGGRSIASEDLDADGDVDLVNCDRDGRRVTLLRNGGSGTFPDVDHYLVGTAPRDIAIADFDGNNTLDLAVADFGDGSVWLIRNKGGVGLNWLGFETPVGYPGGGVRPHAISQGDLDNDNDPDLAMANVGSNNISLLWNDGNAHFNNAEVISFPGFSPVSVLAHDLDNDGDIDLATVSLSTLLVLINHGPCYADCDLTTGIGVLDIFDFLCFQSSFIGSQPSACDCDISTGPGVCDIFDFLCFQTAFVTGCP